MRYPAYSSALFAIFYPRAFGWISGGKYCPSNALQLWPDEVACAASDPSSHAERLPRDPDVTASQWNGPEHCLGEHCIFSNRYLDGGIALITTQENADRVAAFPIGDTLQSGDPPFYEAELPGKGVGLIASRTILQGENIFVRPPALMVKMHLHLNMLPEFRSSLYEKAVMKLPRLKRDAFMRQVGDTMFSKVDRNAFRMGISEDEDGAHEGCFLDASRMNHDCRPNTQYRINNITHTAFAVRDISPGEEITISYIDATITRAERKKRLGDWGFSCTCTQCNQSDEEAAESDERLREIKQIEAKMGNFTQLLVTPDTGARLVELYEKERLDIYIGRAYTRAALNYALFAEESKAREFAQRAVVAMEREFGPLAIDMPAMKILAADPKKHWAWGKRAIGRKRRDLGD